MRPKSVRAFTVIISLFCAHSAQAQDGGNIDLSTFEPAMDSRGLITVDASQVLGAGEVSFGLVTNWGRGLLRFENGANTYEVRNIISPTLVGAFGFRLGPAELELGVSAPFRIMSGDRGPDTDGGTPLDPNDDDDFGIEGQGFGDMGLHAKTRLLDTSRGSGIGLAFVGSLYLPTASRDSWLGGRQLSPSFSVVLDKEVGRLRFAANAGLRYRSSSLSFSDSGMDPSMPGTAGVIEVASTLPFGAGLAYAISEQSFDLVAEVIGAVPLGGVNYQPLEALGGLKLYLARNSFLLLGAGVGLRPGRGANPDLRAFLGVVFEPNVGDRDRDGLKDDVDRCPDDPEDSDDFEDEDGCPDLDNDSDGIPDTEDQCPNEPEDRDGFEDEDGCPEPDAFDRDGDGIIDREDACPDDPEDDDEFEDEDGCPDFDNDRDRLLDVDDLCPNDPEDYDRFEDRDGCPDPDNDRDRVPDKLDQCPGEDGEDREKTAETWNNHLDDDGCPDRGTTYLGDGVLHVLEKIHFEYNKATIKPMSYPILDAVAKTLELNPDVSLIEVQGHTDERGSVRYNLTLSQARAASVVRYLVGKGIARQRLESNGYGESKPLDRRHNQEAWAVNRRVEFVIVKRASGL